MRSYSWYYGIFHWVVHYFLTTMLVMVYFKDIANLFLAIVISSLIDLDHLPILKKFGFRRYILAEKRLVSPLHNFFFLSVFSILASFTSLFISKEAGVLIFTVVLHMIWDIFEDAVIFRTSFRRWEKTWGLNTKEIEETYNEFLKMEPEVKKESRIKKMGSKLKEKFRRKKTINYKLKT